MQTNEVKTKRVHNLIIVDESGSMEVIRKQAFVGMNETLQTVRKMQEKFPDQEQYVPCLPSTAATPPGITTTCPLHRLRIWTRRPTAPVAAHLSTMPSARVSPRPMPKLRTATMCW